VFTESNAILETNCTWTVLQYWSNQNVREVILQTKKWDGANSYLCLQMACGNSISANTCKKCFPLLWWARIQSQIQDHNWHPTRIPFTKQHASTWSRTAWVCSYFKIHHFGLHKSPLSCKRRTNQKISILQKQEGGSILHMKMLWEERYPTPHLGYIWRWNYHLCMYQRNISWMICYT